MTAIPDEPLTETTEAEREKARKPIRAEIKQRRAEVKLRRELSGQEQTTRKRIDELEVLAEKAILVGEDPAVFHEERCRLQDSLKALVEAGRKLLGADARIADLKGKLRELADPNLVEDLFIAKSDVAWALKRRQAAQRDVDESRADDWEYPLRLAELQFAATLVAQAGAEVERLKAEIVAE